MNIHRVLSGPRVELEGGSVDVGAFLPELFTAEKPPPQAI
ncbi:hypothetical protein SAMN06295905_2857 [Devosia lucknowensis]|uniref:Uncharacterized protein n=1 Tax=Devosia lucknowensis TaxID=1096929 RepID=A0A1Y6GCQ1_9HYPH|nr:hypothetical protein SAMN06295905_2857 [Devosia lucknowensis]